MKTLAIFNIALSVLVTKSNVYSENDFNVMFALLVLGVILFVWLLPIISILSSRKTTGSEKLAWLLAVLFISWFAWIFYLLLAPIKKRK